MLVYQGNNNNNGWLLDGSLIGHELDYGALSVPYTTRHLGFIDPSTPSTSTPVNGDLTMTKKLNHNASERYRRKKINSFYSSLQSLLPDADQKKKLSIPATVSWVLKYIPEMQQQVQRLSRQKEDLLSRISREAADVDPCRAIRTRLRPELEAAAAVSVSRLSQEEVVFQISKEKNVDDNKYNNQILFSEIMVNLEKDGFFPMNASTFESFGGRVFYTLHVQCGRNMGLESETLKEMMLSWCEQRRGDHVERNIRNCSNFYTH